MPEGTHVTVERLFQNMPGRLTGLPAVAKEVRVIVDVVIHFALFHTDVHFDVVHDGKRLVHTALHQTPLERLMDFFGTFPVLHIDYQDDHFGLEGYIGLPEQARPVQYQYCAVNSRPISDPEIRSSVKKAYGTLLDHKDQAFFALNISYPYEYLDVNIDPQKKKVTFMRDNILERIHAAVTDKLEKAHLHQKHLSQGIDPHTQELLRSEVIPWMLENVQKTDIIQVEKCYLAWQGEDGLYLVDQHAAHERILYEQFSKAAQHIREKRAVVKLQKPVTVSLPIVELSRLDSLINTVSTLGFSLKKSKTGEPYITHVPILFKDRDLKGLFIELLHNPFEIDSVTHQTLTYMSCRSALKAGESLTKKEARSLIKKLLTCQNPYTCPHGRPTMVSLSSQKLAHMFKR